MQIFAKIAKFISFAKTARAFSLRHTHLSFVCAFIHKTIGKLDYTCTRKALKESSVNSHTHEVLYTNIN